MKEKEYFIFHGRFQPFHNGHLEVIEFLINKGRKLIIGIINPDPWNIWEGDQADSYVFSPNKNPLTYWERFVIISETIKERGYQDFVEAIVPLPRPSINIDQSKRFIPFENSRFVFVMKYNDHSELQKIEQTKLSGGKIEIISDNVLSEEVRPISSSLIRNLIVCGSTSWKNLIPKESIYFYENHELTKRFLINSSYKESFESLEIFHLTNPYKSWSLKYINDITNIEHMQYKPDIFGAIAEALFSNIPVFKGLLKLRNDKKQYESQENLLKEIKKLNIQSIEEIKQSIKNDSMDIKLTGQNSIDNLYLTSLIKYSNDKNTNIHEYIRDTFSNTDTFSGIRNSFSDSEYFKTILFQYDTSIDDFLLLLKENNYDISYIKGSNIKSKIRSFFISLQRMPSEKIFQFIELMYKEFPDEKVFSDVYYYSKGIMD